MADLVLTRRSPFAGLTLPVSAGACTASDATPDAAFSLMPYRGRAGAAGEALGTPLPGPGGTAEARRRRILWSGRAAWTLLGAAPPQALSRHGAVVEISDSLAGLMLTGDGARAVLARLCPLDLYPSAFADGATARSGIAHIAAQVTRIGDGFEILAPRSMAGSLLHEVEAAMISTAAQR